VANSQWDGKCFSGVEEGGGKETLEDEVQIRVVRCNYFKLLVLIRACK
jgi:hypothetical protein